MLISLKLKKLHHGGKRLEAENPPESRVLFFLLLFFAWDLSDYILAPLIPELPVVKGWVNINRWVSGFNLHTYSFQKPIPCPPIKVIVSLKI